MSLLEFVHSFHFFHFSSYLSLDPHDPRWFCPPPVCLSTAHDCLINQNQCSLPFNTSYAHLSSCSRLSSSTLPAPPDSAEQSRLRLASPPFPQNYLTYSTYSLIFTPSSISPLLHSHYSHGHDSSYFFVLGPSSTSADLPNTLRTPISPTDPVQTLSHPPSDQSS